MTTLIALDLAAWQISRQLGLMANCTLLAILIVWIIRPYRLSRLEPPVATASKLQKIGVLKEGE